jgi:hypothetical protein
MHPPRSSIAQEIAATLVVKILNLSKISSCQAIGMSNLHLLQLTVPARLEREFEPAGLHLSIWGVNLSNKLRGRDQYPYHHGKETVAM